ncbi:hypothetical protein IVA83_16920 [Bradyrhizobium sp. 143]|nr:hypothetical protein [Bradyrhizobium sp. 143]MCK1724369.1 hypothetical protein [Bradyrhizobium sp. 142]
MSTGGTRSGQEVLAYGFKKYQLGEVIGSRTEGAVLAATAFLIGGGLLLLAVEDVRVDGERLESVGVAPTIEVQADPASMGLGDPQLDRAIAVLSGARSSGDSPAGSCTYPRGPNLSGFAPLTLPCESREPRLSQLYK